MSFAPASGLRRLTTLARRSTVSVTLLLGVLQAGQLHADPIQQTKGSFEDKFRQLDESLPTPNTWRNAAGQPGHEYWQQQVDYRISAVLDEDNRHLSASQTINYQNNSPDTLTYLWLQLDQNIFRNDSMAELSDDFGGIGRRGPAVQAGDADTPARLSLDELRRQQFMRDVALGYEIASVEDSQGDPLQYTIVGTLMRIDLAAPLRSGQSTSIEMAFSFNIPEEDAVSARSGYEHFPKDEREGGNDLFLLAQWFPRLAAYTDYEGWTNKEFLGRGEFTLEFGDYEVEMTVPADHIVSSTGVLQNPAEVLTAVLVHKVHQRKAEEGMRADFTGLDVEINPAQDVVAVGRIAEVQILDRDLALQRPQDDAGARSLHRRIEDVAQPQLGQVELEQGTIGPRAGVGDCDLGIEYHVGCAVVGNGQATETVAGIGLEGEAVILQYTIVDRCRHEGTPVVVAEFDQVRSIGLIVNPPHGFGDGDRSGGGGGS